MQCGDLERYLEAFLDGRLGRSRSAILRRHLTTCGGCRARIERLRQFERDMQRRFRSMDQDRSLWQGLELDLVASSRVAGGPVLALPRLPPPRDEPAGNLVKTTPPRVRHPLLAMRGGRGSRHSRLAGLVLIAMALGALYQLGHNQLAPTGDLEAAGRIYERILGGTQALALESGDARRLADWLSLELGSPVELPATPPGFELVGADRTALPSGPAGAVLYRDSSGAREGSVLLLVQAHAGEGEPADAAALAPTVGVAAGGLHELSWGNAGHGFTLVSGLGEDELRRFVP